MNNIENDLIPIYIELDGEIKNRLIEKYISFKSEIENIENQQFIVREVSAPYISEENITKGYVYEILAGAASVYILSLAVSNLMDTYYRKPTLQQISSLETTKDKEGKITEKETKQLQLLEPKQAEKPIFELSLGAKGVVIKITPVSEYNKKGE